MQVSKNCKTRSDNHDFKFLKTSSVANFLESQNLQFSQIIDLLHQVES